MVGLFFDFDLQVCYNAPMKTYTHVEDYLEVIAGKRDLVAGTAKGPGWLGYDFSPIVNLARYDVTFLDSITDQTMQGNAMTDKQAELAIKLLLKYTRQLNAKGVSVEPLSTPSYRKSLRVVDRSKRLWMDTETMYLKFPYNQNMITQLRELLTTRQGKAKFDKEAKIWQIAISEYNVNFLMTWAKSHGFEIDPELEKVMDEILEIEKQEFRIELILDNGQLRICNAPTSMLEYLEQRGLTQDMQYLVELADLSSVLGYSIHQDVLDLLDRKVGSDLGVFFPTQSYELKGDHNTLARVINYARVAKRLPVVVFDPNPDSSLPYYEKILGQDNITVVKHKIHDSLEQLNTDILFSYKAVNYKHIPLLISHVGLLVGGEKQIMIQNSEKIIYFNHKL